MKKELFDVYIASNKISRENKQTIDGVPYVTIPQLEDLIQKVASSINRRYKV